MELLHRTLRLKRRKKKRWRKTRLGPSEAFFCRPQTARNRNKRPSVKTLRRDGNAPTAEAGINLSGDFVWEDVCQEVTWHKSGSGGGRSGITRPFCAPLWQRRLYERLTLHAAKGDIHVLRIQGLQVHAETFIAANICAV